MFIIVDLETDSVVGQNETVDGALGDASVYVADNPDTTVVVAKKLFIVNTSVQINIEDLSQEKKTISVVPKEKE